MIKKIHEIYFYFLCFVHGLLFPIISLFQLFIPKLRRRYREEMSFNGPPFHSDHEVCFEVSSEGEFEQIAAILTRMLEAGSKVQLIIGSESLSHRARNLKSQFASLEVRMVPLLSYFWLKTPWTSNLSSLIKAPHLILCRYDFFPELMLKGLKSSRRFSLISASVKSKSLKGLGRLYWKGVYGFFDHIIPASELEKNRLSDLLNRETGSHFDFRQIRILERLNGREGHLGKWSLYKKTLQILSPFNRDQRIIIGSSWESECDILRNEEFLQKLLKKEFILFIAPHKLDSLSVEAIQETVKELAPHLTLETLGVNEEVNGEAAVYVVVKPGILVEMYALFGHAFVGGGYGRSIHSVLEPFLANCQVYCGPKTFRSTEYDLIKGLKPEKVHVVNSASSFYTILKESSVENKDFEQDTDNRNLEITNQFEGHYQELMKGNHSINA